MNNGRLYNTARSVGFAEWAIRQASEYAHGRQAFGKPIMEHQAIQFLLADSTIELYAAHTMGTDCAKAMDAGENVVQKAAIAKAFATEACFRTFDRAIQVFGGMGLTNETRLFRGLNQARTVRIADGTSEILRRTIARGTLRGELPV